MAEYTPTPWHVGPHYKSDVESAHGRVADCGITKGELGAANAAFIVRAANAHDELLEACKRLLTFNEQLCQDVGVSVHYPSAEFARGVIAKVESEP